MLGRDVLKRRAALSSNAVPLLWVMNYFLGIFLGLIGGIGGGVNVGVLPSARGDFGFLLFGYSAMIYLH